MIFLYLETFQAVLNLRATGSKKLQSCYRILLVSPIWLRPFLCACHLKGLSVAPWYKKQNFCRRHVGWYMLLVKPYNTSKSVVLLNRQYEKRKVIGSILSYTCLIKGYELVRFQYLHAHCISCRYKRGLDEKTFENLN